MTCSAGRRRVGAWPILAVTATLCSVATRSGGDALGVRLDSSLQGARVVTTVSPEGAVFSHYAAAGRGSLVRQFIVRFSDGAAWAVDGEHRTFFATTAAARMESGVAQMRHIMSSTPGFVEGRAVSGPARLAILSERSTIDGVPIIAAVLTMPERSWRIWFAPSLPRVPEAMKSGLAQLVPVDAQSSANLAKIVGYPVVRSEFDDGAGWRTVLDTQSIQRVLIASTEFAPPVGYTPIAHRGGAPGPPPGGADLSAHVIRGPGPEMSNPELSVVFWGKVLNDPAHEVGRAQLRGALQDMVRDEYIARLSDYDIRSARIDGVYYRPDLPPRAVGSSNFAAISAMVYDVGFKERAPIFWWMVGGHDPMYALLVAESEVDNGGWGGYHFVAFSLTHAVLPFPASLFAHDALPWLLAKIPDSAMRVGPETRSLRYGCAGPVAARPSGCDGLPGFDAGTNTVSHEFVETASDPYVFLGWSDPTKQPFYSKSEIADICEFSPLPWADSTVVRETSVSTYWSNSARACVPESRATLTVFEPTAGLVVPTTTGHVTLRGQAHDPVDGPVSSLISWSVDGHALGHGETADSGPLAEGSHALTAVVTNSRGLQTTASLGFAVSMPAAKVTIFSPGAGDYWSNQGIVLRGQGFLYQPGDVPDGDLRWDDGGALLGTGPLLFRSLPALGDHAIRLSLVRAGQVVAAATVNIRVRRAGPHTRTPPGVMITTPTPGQSVFNLAYGADRSGPIQFAATVTDGTGAPVPATVSWSSDLDGPLGSGAVITTTLRGGYCAPSVHRITVTAVGANGARGVDTIELAIGQVC